MDIYEFYKSRKSFTIPQIAADQQLTTDIQKVLI
jgi:hypothetical protein